MSRRIHPSRADAPNPEVPQTWTPVAEPFIAPNGLTVSFPASVDALFPLGDHFNNALELRGFCEMYASKLVSGELQIYAVSGPDGLQSCGELKVFDGKVKVIQDRAHNNRPGTPETGAAVAAFAEALNEGRVEANLAIGERGFEQKAPTASP